MNLSFGAFTCAIRNMLTHEGVSTAVADSRLRAVNVALVLSPPEALRWLTG